MAYPRLPKQANTTRLPYLACSLSWTPFALFFSPSPFTRRPAGDLSPSTTTGNRRRRPTLCLVATSRRRCRRRPTPALYGALCRQRAATSVYTCICAQMQPKGKSSSSSSASSSAAKRATTTTRGRGKAEKKVYSLPGQKFDPPEEREPLRIFYESLSKQIPSSEMAEFWLMEHGLLSPERAKKAYERKQKRQQQVRMGTPIKSSVIRKDKPESSKKPTPSSNMDWKAKKRNDYSDDDDDFIVKRMKKSKG